MGTLSSPMEPTYARPPIRSLASRIRTERPRCCNSFAALSPDSPAPTMITSYLWTGYFPLDVQYASSNGGSVKVVSARCGVGICAWIDVAGIQTQPQRSNRGMALIIIEYRQNEIVVSRTLWIALNSFLQGGI